MRPSPLYALLILASCSSGGRVVTMNAFYDIPVGASQEEVVKAAGKPFAIHRKEDGSLEYEYIERFQTGGRTINERHYFIRIKDGRVVSKTMEQASPLPYTFDSYDMQTTQNGDSLPPDPPASP